MAGALTRMLEGGQVGRLDRIGEARAALVTAYDNRSLSIANSIANSIGEVNNLQQELRLWLEKISVETGNGNGHIDGRLASGI